VTFAKFVGPGFMVSVAYSMALSLCKRGREWAADATTVGPASYTAAVVAGHWHQFSLLFVVLLSNIFAMFLQALAIKLGTVSGLNLAEACRAFLPRWLNLVLFFMVQAAIMATNFTEVSNRI
jgi:metal iron transporter